MRHTAALNVALPLREPVGSGSLERSWRAFRESLNMPLRLWITPTRLCVGECEDYNVPDGFAE